MEDGLTRRELTQDEKSQQEPGFQAVKANYIRANIQSDLKDVAEIVEKRGSASDHDDTMRVQRIVDTIKQKIGAISPTIAESVTYNDVWNFARIKVLPMLHEEKK